MGTTSTDRIEKQLLLRAPRSRVWRALTTAEEFGSWFGVKLHDPIALGAHVKGTITHPDYAHHPYVMIIERLDKERVFAWRWHHIIDGKVDLNGPTTLCVFELEEAPGGTLLKFSESGFDQLPLSHRDKLYRGNEEGWTIQMGNIEKHVSATA
ncbi:SRPBCC family protein [Hyalangium minutum]|uniref:Activator of Hsp90 ATPase homologue 1/2-like C-terminal domain-containing protein n=1 Tax=Hyalangium minutum TaxID=394096 RepID=A0A085WPR3_9BACT|nr:SRPBCC family protein [Hyalangium minutum]KFE69676.1 hypothetical protein DB31_6651 [Hyalangium minutum]